jgi:lysophospholipase L1-like esterase
MRNPKQTTMLKTVLLSLAFVVLATTAPAAPAPAAREGIEWCDIWIAHANETNLPRVLLIGDSIARGYYPAVESALGGKAYVARLATSAFLTDSMLHQQIALVLDNTRFDVIHFNNGLHGWQHSEAEYRRAFPGFLATIQKHAPKAKLIWAATTPLKESTNAPPASPTQASNERVAARNAIAAEYVKAQGIPVNDLNALARGHPELYSDGVHFNREGIALQARQVATQIEHLLPR